MKNKKFLAVLLSLAMLLSVGTFAALADEPPPPPPNSDGSIEFKAPDQGDPGIVVPPNKPPGDDENTERWNAIMNMDLSFGVVEATSNTKTYESIEAMNKIGDGAGLLPIEKRVAGLRIESNDTEWHVAVTIGEFKHEGNTYLEGFKFALQSYTGVTHSTTGPDAQDYSAPIEFGIATGGDWSTDGATKAKTIGASDGSPGSPAIIVAEGNNPGSSLLNAHYGANYEAFLEVPGASVKPDGEAQAVLTWNYVAAPAP